MRSILRRQWLGGAALVLSGGQWLLRPAPARREDRPPPDFRAVYAAARPSVVVVSADRDPARADVPAGDVAGLGPRGGRDAGARQGSGFAVGEEGLVLTNHHVVAGARRITVELMDGRVVPAEEVGGDPQTDLAVLRIPDGLDVPRLRFAPGPPPPPGTPVMAIGHPFGYVASATVGVVSGHGRAYDELDPTDFLQHDAALNSGNSGGPLLGLDGAVLGVNTATPDSTMVDVGVALAIPAASAAQVFHQLATHGYVQRAWLGVAVQALGPELAGPLGVPARSGLAVVEVADRSPAAQVLAPGDVLRSLDGRPLAQVRDLPRALASSSPGGTTRAVLLRGGAEATVEVRLGLSGPPDLPRGGLAAAPSAPPSDAQAPAVDEMGIGLRVAAGPASRGTGRRPVLVTGAAGEAARSGLRHGDEILAVGTSPAGSAAQVAAAVTERARSEAGVALLVRRQGQRPQYVALTKGGNQLYAPRNVTFPSGGPY